MSKYTIKKVLNNNVVIAEQSGSQFVLVGKAIGYEAHKGEVLSEDRIESIFIKKSDDTQEKFNKVLESIDSKIVGVSEEIISLCENELNTRLSEAVHVSLPDHINFAYRRIQKGVKIENPFLYELRALYPAEYNLAEKALYMINQRFEVQLPEDEVGFICMHIKAAINQQEVSDALAYTRKIGEVMELISILLKKKLQKNSLEYVRTVTHLNFMIERVISKKTVKNFLLDSIKKDLYNQYDVAIKVAKKIENLFSVKVPEDEIGYIALHLNRISET
jgi:transcriptional antiterminator